MGGEWVHTQGAAVDMVVAGLGWKKALVATREGNSLLGSTKGVEDITLTLYEFRFSKESGFGFEQGFAR